MGLVINNNMMAANTARTLSNTYDRLNTSVQRLSSGLRINGAADDAAGLAIRELMRADIATMQQGIRNAADGISLLQTAEGGMAVIDEKLVRLKELAEQAATGTYTTVQREIINSEYQAMAAEIDRIATSTNFNGVKLLDGSISNIHQGLGLKLHFGTGNNPAEDYYFINMGDVRATSQSGLRIGGDAKNDIWGTVGTHGGPNTTGCCGGGIPSLTDSVPGWKSGEVFSFGYNWDWKANNKPGYDNGAPQLTGGRYIAGAWQVGSAATLQELMDLVNKGSQARVRVDFEYKAAKYTVAQSGYPALDLTAYYNADPSLLTTNCGIDENYRVAGDIEVVMSTSAKPPTVCFVDGEYWPPAGRFVFSAGLYKANGIGWMTADGNNSPVRFSGFTREDMAAGDPPSYIILGADGLTSATVWFTDDDEYGEGFYHSGGVWYDADHVEARYSVTRPVEPVFILELDGQIQIVSPSNVEGDSDTGFKLKVGTWVKKTQAGGITLADLLGKTSARNKDFDPLNVLVDKAGNYQYQLTSAGALSVGLGSAGTAVTKTVMDALIANLADPSLLGNPPSFKLLVDTLEYIEIRPGTPVRNPDCNLAYVLEDNSANAHYTLTSAGAFALSSALNTPGRFSSGDALSTAVLTSAIVEFGLTNSATSLAELFLGSGGSAYIQLNVPPYSMYNITRQLDFFDVSAYILDVDKVFSSANLFSSSNIGLIDYFGTPAFFYDVISSADGAHRFCLGDYDVETYYIGSATLGATSFSDRTTDAAISLSAMLSDPANPFGGLDRDWRTIWAISALAYAINNNSASQFWARLEGIGQENGGEGLYRSGYTSLYIFAKDGGAKGNQLSGCDEQLGDIRGDRVQYDRAVWYNDELEAGHSAGTYFGNGGKDWGTLRAVPTGYGSWGVQLHGKDVGRYRDLWILNVGNAANSDIRTAQKDAYTGIGFGYNASTGLGISNLLGLDRASFVEVQNAADGEWAGAHIRTQSDAQEALDAIQGAIERKDKVRATLGAYINRLENTITNLEIQAENLQASESRISDVDLATEMTNFVRNQVLTQAAVSMLSQANSLPQMALALLNG